MITHNLSFSLRKFTRTYRVECVVFLLALIVRLALFSVNLSHNSFDVAATIHGDDGYYEISQSLVEGTGFGSTDEQGVFTPNPLRPPVWPFLIAGILIIFKSYWAVAILELLMGSLIPVIGMRLVRYVFDDKRISSLTGILMALEPYAVFLSFVLYTETSFTFFFLLSLLFLFRYFKEAIVRNIVWFSVFFGLATLIKPTIQYLPLVIIAALIFHARHRLSRKVFVHAGLFLVIFCAVIFPWLYRNHREFGVWGMSAQPAFNLYVYLVPTVLAIDNGTDFKTEWLAFVKKDGFDENSITLANSSYFTHAALEVIKEHPKELAISFVTTGITFFTHDGLLTIFSYAGNQVVNTFQKPALGLLVSDPGAFITVLKSSVNGPISLIIIARLTWFIITALAFIGVFYSLRRKGWLKTEILISILIVAYFAATTAINGFGVNARFKIPVEVFIFAFALNGLLGMSSRILDRFRNNK